MRLREVRDRVSLRSEQVARMAELAALNVASRRPAVARGGPVVSLTSYGKRARTVAFTLESIAQGSLLPSRLLLWLDEPELLQHPPSMLRRLQRRGVEILRTDDYGPHKKYYPYVASQRSFDAPLVTADDDVLYPRDWLAELVAAHGRQPDAVQCYRARVMVLSGDRFAPYATWSDCCSTAASHRHFSVGLAGVLFPQAVLGELQRQGDAFRATCPRTDDIWLNLHAQRVDAKVRQVLETPRHFLLLPGTQQGALLHGNLQGGNDAALQRLYQSEDLLRLREQP